MAQRDPLTALQAENERLIALLEANGIEWRVLQEPPAFASKAEVSRLTTSEKVALFCRLFRGRTDVYPVRWESKTTGKSGYAPACANEWRAGVCQKPRIKCGDCGNRLLIPLSEAVIYGHLAGDHTVGVYPLLEDDSCYFLAIDFDEAEWREDARAPRIRAATSASRLRSRSRAREMGRMPGCSSLTAYQLGMLVDWEPPSSVTPVRAPDN